MGRNSAGPEVAVFSYHDPPALRFEPRGALVVVAVAIPDEHHVAQLRDAWRLAGDVIPRSPKPGRECVVTVVNLPARQVIGAGPRQAPSFQTRRPPIPASN